MDQLKSKYIMEYIKKFFEAFFRKEAECWTKDGLNNLDGFNTSVRELHSLAIDRVGKGFGIYERDELTPNENPTTYTPRHLYKLSAYNHPVYGDIWVAYASSTTTDSDPKADTIFEAFIVGEVEHDLKVIGTMTRYKDRATMKVKGWKGSAYNPKDLDIKKLGKFLGTERLHEPGNYDDFSLKEYLKDA